jgi:hypothetical protein
MGGRWVAVWLVSTFLFGATAFGQEDPKKFCTELTANSASVWEKSIYYRSPDTQKITKLEFNDQLYRHLNEQLFYFSRSSSVTLGRPGVLNIKLVYLLKPKLKPTSLVNVSNDRWDHLSTRQIEKIKDACSRLTVDEYEGFHLRSIRNFCLNFLFHQTEPFDTLATPDRRRTFAFDNMIPSSNVPFDNPLVAFKFLIGRAQAAEPSNGTSVETAPRSYASSIIRNFTFGGSVGQCVEIGPISFPVDATLLHLRVTNLGVNVTDTPDSNDWLLQIMQ